MIFRFLQREIPLWYTQDMNRIFATLVIAIILLGVIFVVMRKPKDSPIIKTENLVGCYVFESEKNVYTLTIQEQTESVVSGTLHYDNFQFDDSSGAFAGKFENEILLGDYTGTAEGTTFTRELIWKRSGKDFIQGSGDYTTINEREVFSDPSAVTWDQNRTFVSSPCE